MLRSGSFESGCLLGSLNELGPIAYFWIVFHIDPDVGLHGLAGNQDNCSGKADAGENFVKYRLWWSLVFCLHLEGLSRWIGS